MIANLENEEYINNLVEESYAITFTQSTTNTVAQKKVKKAFEAGGCHIGAKDKHVSWKAGNGDFQTVDAFLESDNSAGTVRDQLALYTLFLMFDTRIRYEVCLSLTDNTPRTPTTALVRFDEVEGPPSKYLVDHDRLFIPDFPLA